MANNRTLQVALTGILSAQYRNIETDVSDDDAKDDISYTKIKASLANGSEVSQVDLLYHARRDFDPPGPQTLDLNNALQNKWGDVLDFYTIKVVVIKNLEVLGSDKYLKITIQSEVYYIGPQGVRIMWEPDVLGLLNEGVSSGGDPGNLVIDGDNSIDYDLIIAGTENIINISSGL